MGTGVTAEAREPVIEDAEREALLRDPRDDGAPRAVLAGGALSIRPTRLLAVTVPLRDGLFRRNVREARPHDACRRRAVRHSLRREAARDPLVTEASV